MIDVAESLTLVLAEAKNFGVEEVPLLIAAGRVLAEDIIADRDYPPFDRVTMDGIAIASSVFIDGIREFKMEAIQAAGQPQVTLTNKKNCIEVMTGAMLPIGTDAVIPYELCDIRSGSAIVNTDMVAAYQNVHRRGVDSKQGEVLIAKDARITPAVIGLLASSGYNKVKVYHLPKIAVCATGDELVPVKAMPLPHQIRQSNSYMLTTALQKDCITASQYHLPDNALLLKEQLTTITAYYDVVLLSGAVSKGKFDYLPRVLNEMGFSEKFHGIAQRPGKPFLFGKMPNGALIFGFPGNPVSTYVCYQLYFRGWLNACLKQQSRPASAFLSKPFTFKPDLTLHLLVNAATERGKVIAHPVETSTSGDLVSLAAANAILTLAKGRDEFGTDEAFSLHWL
ncbi:molybdopterin molybdotransferase MoeA [Mucilaginibacter ginkgonis]|uniref:Molybdopterin molybdenumtransferase n=1 Tax=Mucilaginibacter ginkgonis TaxID=2682091 RepID=A0A6I4I2G9_9SPHI|nr:molybdopterin molybdotransferase MoeA [Mucilaginibacter ginkgonis]QQL50733.1 molybdopterin molybdotransferase MoeA [Mucilaginibacter ginkgonis]